MINLLPKTEKDILKRGLKLRFFIVSAGLVFFGMFAGVVFLSPSYVLAVIKSSEIKLKGTPSNILSQEEKNKLIELPNKIKNKLQIMEMVVNKKSISDTFFSFLADMPNGVAINSISFTDSAYSNVKKNQNKEILISGIARSRNDLTSFSDLLRKNDKISGIDLPVSNFIKENNIPFSLKIIFID